MRYSIFVYSIASRNPPTRYSIFLLQHGQSESSFLTDLFAAWSFTIICLVHTIHSDLTDILLSQHTGIFGFAVGADLYVGS